MSNGQFSPLIEAMLKPEFYPHPVTSPVQLIQTHVSYVFLTGDYAYKVKKPVNFGFLDYSTVEKRQHFCQEELRMNRRSAPELYLEVLPISQEGSEYQLGQNGEIVEYVLKMRAFNQDDLWSARFANGLIGEKDMEDLGKVVADFHAQTITNDYIAQFGEIPKVRESVDDNYAQTQKYIGGPQTQQQFEETKAYTDGVFASEQELFARRISLKKIRECHGDLHLRNIAQWGDKILLFDCIEFNEPFRLVDVIYDVAFAVMDVEARGRKDLANAFLNAYLEQTGDWEGVPLLSFYCSRQAYVRGKVTSFLLDDPGVSAEEKQQAHETAAAYYQLAWSYTQRSEGKLFLMSGLSGSGKSTVGKLLARRLGAIHIRSDAVRKHLGGVALDQRGGDDLYTPEMTQRTYGRVLELGLMLAELGWPVILDAKYDREQLRGEAIAAAKAAGLPLQIVNCTAPEAVLRDRLRQRTGDIADATADLLAAQIAGWEPFTPEETPLVLTIETTTPIEPQLAAVTTSSH
ncbi:MAG TPA: AAA family ATPase [Oscillatoriaceae cyanobacterium M33_DOE_052]|uniref:gluconokinase n=1 Tax=Planktothricoides sp. SpSt-374 TaxID=2282167 RepID=A0A7C3ZVW7_9CYAN|nr:AAA family ATPase [Oscillatoriaceae cyanobacterium M33_DOE_052]